MKKMSLSALLIALLLLLCGCHQIGDKAASVSSLYAATAVLSVVLLLAYLFLVKEKNVWFTLLYVAVPVVNIGYFYLSVAPDLSAALLANRIAYLGSVFLPLTMMMIILNVIKTQYKKWLPATLIAVAAVVFAVAASPGYSDIYYKEVTLVVKDGVSMLDKVYGDWHIVYLVYLVCYFAAMIVCIAHSIYKKKIKNTSLAVVFAIAVFINLGVWLTEQLVKFDFEMLSISYIISELFLLGIYITLRSAEPTAVQDGAPVADIPDDSTRDDAAFADKVAEFEQGMERLTRTERVIFELYINGKGTKEVLSELNIKENTLKFHNKNLYGKLGVSSKKQLLEIYKATKS